jgi:hypothetical protein
MSTPAYLRQLASNTGGEIKCWIEQSVDSRVMAEQSKLESDFQSKMTFWDKLAAALNITSESPEGFGACAAVADRWARAQLTGTGKQFRRDFNKGIPQDTIDAQKKYALTNKHQLESQKKDAIKTAEMHKAASAALCQRLLTLEQQARIPGADIPQINAEIREIGVRMRKISSFLTQTYPDFYSPKAIQANISQETLENILISKEDEQPISSCPSVAKMITDTLDKHAGVAYCFSMSKDKRHHRIAASHLIRNKTLVECIEDGGHLSKFRFLDANTGEWIYTSWRDFEKFLALYFELIYSSYIGGTISVQRYSMA